LLRLAFRPGGPPVHRLLEAVVLLLRRRLLAVHRAIAVVTTALLTGGLEARRLEPRDLSRLRRR
jgi:hypothetical protein